MKKGLITIVIPTLNSWVQLTRLFSSLENQTYKKFEIIVNDDKRTKDGTKEKLLEYQKKFPVKYIQKNRVTAHGRKMGAYAGQGEFILHLDADMKLSKGLLMECIKRTKQGCDALVIPEVPYGEQNYWTRVKCFERSLYVGDESIECARFSTTQAYKSVGGHNVNMTFGEDKDFDIRIRAAGYKVCRTKAAILQKAIKKKFYYGITSNVLFDHHPEYFLLYANTIFRPAFFRNWKKLIKHPVLAMSMFFLKMVESTSGLVGLIYSRLPLAKGDLKSKWR